MILLRLFPYAMFALAGLGMALGSDTLTGISLNGALGFFCGRYLESPYSWLALAGGTVALFFLV